MTRACRQTANRTRITYQVYGEFLFQIQISKDCTNLIDTENWEYQLLNSLVKSQSRSTAYLEEGLKLLEKSSKNQYCHVAIINIQKFINGYPGANEPVLNILKPYIVIYKIGPYFIDWSYCPYCGILVEIPMTAEKFDADTPINHESQEDEAQKLWENMNQKFLARFNGEAFSN